MFDTLKNPSDFFKFNSEYFTKFPTSESEMKSVFEKVKAVFESETESNKEVWKTFNKAARGDATANEISAANKKVQEMLTTARFSYLLAIPGTIFFLPALIKYAKEYDIDLVPKSVAKEFNI